MEYMQIDISSPDTEYHNVIKGPLGLRTRPGLFSQINIASIGNVLQNEFIFGFSCESANTGQAFHYLFTLDTNDNCYQSIYDEQMRCRAFSLIGKLSPDQEPFSVAINYNQIIVNSRSLPYPLWGFVGGTLIRAQKVESINPDTRALTLFPGRVCSFADRFAWAYANQVIFNDPGTEPRTITANNSISFGGTVLDLFQSGEGGNLVIVCTDAVYTIPPDGLNGYQFQGVINRIPGYQGSISNNAATARGGTVGLVKDGIISIGADFAKRELTTYRRPRALLNYLTGKSSQVGPYASGDYRAGSLLAADEGFFISINNKTCFYDLDSLTISWIYPSFGAWYGVLGNDAEIVVRGLLKDSNGKTFMITPKTVVDMWGNRDVAVDFTSAPYDGDDLMFVIGQVFKNVPSNPELSPVVREITVGSDNTGNGVWSSIRDSINSATVPSPPKSNNIVGVSNWNNGTKLYEKELRSRRMQRAVRIDSPDFELAFIGNCNISPTVDIVTRGIGKTRPSN